MSRHNSLAAYLSVFLFLGLLSFSRARISASWHTEITGDHYLHYRIYVFLLSSYGLGSTGKYVECAVLTLLSTCSFCVYLVSVLSFLNGGRVVKAVCSMSAPSLIENFYSTILTDLELQARLSQGGVCFVYANGKRPRLLLL